MRLSPEQNQFVKLAKKGKNVLVDACIGSGKTTSIQEVCNYLLGNLLYLTYNRRLMDDAKAKIQNENVEVRTFHSFAGKYTYSAKGGVSQCLKNFLKRKPKLELYDTVIVDEYQDLQSDTADVLRYIKSYSQKKYGKAPQFLIVGDMCQKIYDYSVLNIPAFIEDLLGDFEKVNFTQCFRLSAGHAASLGQVWSKSIIGVNKSCKIEWTTDIEYILKTLKKAKPEQVLCLGRNNGVRTGIQNALESTCPQTFNKNTVYASIRDTDSDFKPDSSKCAIFTTFDASKGLERDICVVCDFTKAYWKTRNLYDTPEDILRNMFLVAASRGKKKIIFFKKEEKSEQFIDLSHFPTHSSSGVDMRPISISGAFDYKYFEDVDACLDAIKTEELTKPEKVINIPSHDGNIDLSPCIGIYAQAIFFKHYNIDTLLQEARIGCEILLPKTNKNSPLTEKILALTAAETLQARYAQQANTHFVSEKAETALTERLRTKFSGNEKAESKCCVFIESAQGQKALNGRADVVLKDSLFELKFVTDLKKEHFLQCALYMIALNKPVGYLWNLRNNNFYSIEIPNKTEFMRRVCRCISKRQLTFVRYYTGGKEEAIEDLAGDSAISLKICSILSKLTPSFSSGGKKKRKLS